MPISAYSEMFQCELDVEQYLQKRNWNINEITDEIRTAAKNDISCPSCGITLTIRKQAVNKESKLAKAVATFSAIGSNHSIETAHHSLCEYSLQNKTTGNSSSVDFMKARTESQKQIRLLVCKAIHHEVISNKDIKDFRRWAFESKCGLPLIFQSNEESDLEEGKTFASTHINEMWIAQKNTHEITYPLYKQLKMDIQTVNSYKLLLSKISQNTPDPSSLIKHYLKLSILKNYFKGRSIHPKKNSQNHFDAFLSFVLFLHKWDAFSSIEFIRRISNLPDPDDLTLGNINGINPFAGFNSYIFCKLAVTQNANFIDELNEGEWFNEPL